MKLFSLRINLLLFTTFLLLGYFAVRYVSLPKYSQVFYVKASKEFNPNFTNQKFDEFIKEGNYYPGMLAINRKVGFPYIIYDLHVHLNNKGLVTINNHEAGNLENLDPLKQILEKLFYERTEEGIFEEGTKKAYKRVVIRAPRSAKYGDIVKIIDVLKSSGADPVILQIDDLPQ